MSKPETVRFNVGGKEYEASRSLFEQKQHETTMLARLVSERWQQKLPDPSSSVIFIDRDGEHFRYVLHYLRYGKVSIPFGSTISKESLLDDMDYYGIDVPKGSIKMSGSGLKDTLNAYSHMTTRVEKKYRSKLKSLDGQKKDLDDQKQAVIAAYECFKVYCQSGAGDKLTFGPDHVPSGEKALDAVRSFSDDGYGLVYLEERLAEYGLKFSFYLGRRRLHFITLKRIKP